jgi:hypothetical protein
MTEIIALSSNQKWENEGEKRRGEKGATGRHLGGAGGDQERKNGMNEWMDVKSVVKKREKYKQGVFERVLCL